jgi:hypothetical protein
MYDDVIEQLKRDFIVRYWNYPIMHKYGKLEFLNNLTRTRWLIKLYYYIKQTKQKRLKYKKFYNIVIIKGKYDFMKVLTYYLGAGEYFVLNRMHSLFFISTQRNKMSQMRFQYLLKDSSYIYKLFYDLKMHHNKNDLKT